MARIPFITYREMDATGILRYYILQKDFPHNVGVVLSQPKYEAICMSIIPSYNLYVVWDGTLRGNVVAAYPDYKVDLQLCFDNMAAWFWAERIVMDKKRFEKFKIKQDVSTN